MSMVLATPYPTIQKSNPCRLTGSESRGLGELLIELPLAVGQVLRDDDADLRQEIALAAAGLREPAAAQPDLASRRRSGRYPHPHAARGGLHLGLAAQHGLRGG